MPDLRDKHRDAFVLKMADEAVVAHVARPQTLLFTPQRLVPQARIFCRCQPVAQKSVNRSLPDAIKLCDLLLGGASDLNSPRHDDPLVEAESPF